MEKIKFEMIVYSKVRFLCVFFIYIVSITLVALLFLPIVNGGQIYVGLYLIISTSLFFFIFPKYFAKAILEITIHTEGFQYEWIKPYWGSKSKKTKYIRFDELKSYRYEISYNFATFKLKLKSGKIIKFHRWFFDDKDDFDKFLTHFRRKVENYNKKKSTAILIEKEKLIMENRTFLTIIAVLIGVIILATILFIIFKGVNNWKGIIYILIVFGPLVWVIRQVISGIRHTKNKVG